MSKNPPGELWRQLTEIITDFYHNIHHEPVKPIVKPQTIRDHLQSRYDFEDVGIPLSESVDDVAGMLRRWNTHVTHPRYFGLFTPNSSPASVAADSLTALFNPQLAAWSHSPAACEIERHVLLFLANQFGLDPNETHANFTTGGSEANLSAVITALTRQFPDFGDAGMRGLSGQPTLYISQEGHDSFMKIAHMSGLGRGALRHIPVTSDLKMDIEALKRRVQADKSAGFAPFMVAATAGATSSGAIDPLPQLVEFCRQENLWLHVDAAWGGAATLSPKLAPLLAGIEGADSITCDAHKWFSVAMGAGMFFCRHPYAVAEAFRVKAAYMPLESGHAPNNYATTVQWSRRFIGLKLFLALAEKGRAGYQAQIERQTELGHYLRRNLKKHGWTLLNDTPLPVICFTHPQLEEKGEHIDFVERLQRDCQTWISTTCLRNRTPALRACITNYASTEQDIDYLVESLDYCLA